MPQTLKSPAKINLSLEILDKDSSGFHTLKSVIMEIPGLFDEIQIKKNDQIEIDFQPKISCKTEDSTVFKAAKLLLPPDKGIQISIKKNIPEESGLGGGASNAATVLKAINQMYNLGYTDERLRKIGEKIGMDVPYFISGKTALVSHFGENIEPLPDVNQILKDNGFTVKIVQTNVNISTKWAYSKISPFIPVREFSRNDKLIEQLQTDNLIKAIQTKNIKKILNNLQNNFEPLIYNKYPKIKQQVDNLKIKEALSVHLCGSGGAIYGIFRQQS